MPSHSNPGHNTTLFIYFLMVLPNELKVLHALLLSCIPSPIHLILQKTYKNVSGVGVIAQRYSAHLECIGLWAQTHRPTSKVLPKKKYCALKWHRFRYCRDSLWFSSGLEDFITKYYTALERYFYSIAW